MIVKIMKVYNFPEKFTKSQGHNISTTLQYFKLAVSIRFNQTQKLSQNYVTQVAKKIWN